jgi:hypothetical protein
VQALLARLLELGFFEDTESIPDGEWGPIKRALMGFSRSRTDILYALPADLVGQLIGDATSHRDRKVYIVHYQIRSLMLPLR